MSQEGEVKVNVKHKRKVMIERKQEVRSNTKSGKLSHTKELNKGDERETKKN